MEQHTPALNFWILHEFGLRDNKRKQGGNTIAGPPLRRRGKILFVWYGPDSGVM